MIQKLTYIYVKAKMLAKKQTGRLGGKRSENQNLSKEDKARREILDFMKKSKGK